MAAEAREITLTPPLLLIRHAPDCPASRRRAQFAPCECVPDIEPFIPDLSSVAPIEFDKLDAQKMGLVVSVDLPLVDVQGRSLDFGEAILGATVMGSVRKPLTTAERAGWGVEL